jgi:putative pyruvate formate lyase activating enzyme
MSLKPSYLALYDSGILRQRVSILRERLSDCDICPRKCHVDRLSGEMGYCESGRLAYVCSYCDHHGEEPPLSGTNGSGTIFLGRCNLRCVYCQNADISQKKIWPEKYLHTAAHFARIMLHLQDVLGCHNINFVSPTHFIPQIVEAVYLAIPRGLHIPLVYNSNGYDDAGSLKLLDGIIDIYLPDLKYSDERTGRKYSAVPDYPAVSRRAVTEMYRQVGLLQTSSNGIALRGLIIRHLVLPNDLSGSIEILRWIAGNLSPKVSISLMAQFYPAHRAPDIPLLSRGLRHKEYERVLNELHNLNFENALYQELKAEAIYRPHFFEGDHPFETREET